MSCPKLSASRSLCVVLGVVGALNFAGAADDELSSAISALKQQEAASQSYKIEFSKQSIWWTGLPAVSVSNTRLKTIESYFVVIRDNENYRVKVWELPFGVSSSSELPSDVPWYKEIVWDGTASYFLDAGLFVDLSAKDEFVVNHTPVIRPEGYLVSPNLKSLSEFLSKHKAENRLLLKGNELVDGKKLIKLEIVEPETELHNYLWLDPAAGYRWVKQQVFEKEIMTMERRIELKEWVKGVFFPSHMSQVHFDEQTGDPDGRSIDFKVNKFSVVPTPSPEIKFEFRKGMKVRDSISGAKYEIK